MNPNENTLEIMGPGSIEQMERAQIDMQIATAKRYPRNVARARDAIVAMATMDEDTATACFYTLPRGGKSIQGPSVRLAEIALACYGNLRAGSRIISSTTSGETPHVVVQSVAHDLETNVAVTIEKRRRITPRKDREGNTFVDEDAVNLAVNACSAIAFRDAVFKVVPRAMINPALDAARKKSVGETKSLVANRTRVLKRLNQMGVTDDRILAAVGVDSISDIDADKLADLIGIGTSIRDGATTIEEAFPEVAAKAKTEPESKLETAPAPAAPVVESKPPTESPQSRLASLVTGAGFTFDDWASWAGKRLAEKYGKELANVDSFETVPDDIAKRCIAGTEKMLSEIGGAK
jgi:hypothetical protein